MIGFVNVIRCVCVALILIIGHLILFPSLSFALDPKQLITQYGHDIWNDELPQSTVHCLIQTRDGYIWMGTYEGVVRFDGIEFIADNKRNTAELKRPGVLALHEDRAGTLWIGMLEGGLASFRDGKFKAYGQETGLSNDTVRTIYQDRTGKLWVGTDNGINLLQDDKFISYTTNNGLVNNQVRAITEDSLGNLWIGTEEGLSLFKNGQFTNYTTKDGLPNNSIRTIYPDKNGALWISTSSGAVFWQDGVKKIYTTQEGLTTNNIRSILPDTDGNIWLGTENGGLQRLFNDKVEVYQIKQGLSNDNIRSLLEDREGSLWVGTTSGLNRFRTSKFINYTSSDGLANDFVRAILEDSKGNFWVGTDGGGLSLFQNGKFTNYTTKDGLVSDLVRSLYEDKEGKLWVGTNEGLSYFYNGKFTNYTTKDGLPHNSIYCINQDKEGNFWFGTNGGGASLFKDGKFTNYGVKDGLLNLSVRTIFLDREGNLWFGTYSGLNSYKNGQIFSHTKKDGVSGNAVFSAYQDSQGDIWFTTNDGFTRYKQGKFTPYATKTGLFDGISFQILEDSRGYLWASTSKGILSVKKSDFNDYDQGKISNIAYTMYGKIDGMKTHQCNGASQPCAIKSKDGRLWFATAKGITTIAPDETKLNQLAPDVYITKAIVDGVSLNPTEKVVLDPGKEKYEFHYTGLSFLALEKVKFKFMLVGYDKDWVIANTRRVAYYTHIPPGEYQFRVIACNNDGVWNETGASFYFTLKTHPLKTNWAYAFYISSFLALGYTGVRYRVKVLQRRNELLESKVQERTLELNQKNEQLLLSAKQIEQKNQLMEQVNKELASSHRETEQKNQLLEQVNKELAEKNSQLILSKEQLVESYKRAEKIFSAMSDILPSTILDDKYRLEAKIGSGGYGVIYQAMHVSMQRPVAVKIFRPASGNVNSEALERFRLEGISACRINHPNAVAVLDSNITPGGIAYLVMELLQGKTLAQELESQSRLSPKRALEIIIPVCNVLAQAHEVGIIHRDIKPDNIFLHQSTEGEVVKVVDFGIAKLAGDTFNMELSKLTGTGTLIGTPTYMSPERLSNKTYDGKSDVYSLGVVLYEVLSGYPPFDSFDDNVWALINMQLTEDPQPLASILVDIPAQLDEVVLKALVKDPEKRPSAQDLAADLTAVLATLNK